MTPLRTIGYEGHTSVSWIHQVVSAGVEVVVDVRDVPLSRKPGFSKSAMCAALAEEGVDYVHIRALGNPKALREALKAGLGFDDFAGEFARILDARDEPLRELAVLAADRHACLVCFEEDPARCHRSLVADRVARMSDGALRVEHLRHAC